jgi:hypothetical protein
VSRSACGAQIALMKAMSSLLQMLAVFSFICNALYGVVVSYLVV